MISIQPHVLHLVGLEVVVTFAGSTVVAVTTDSSEFQQLPAVWMLEDDSQPAANHLFVPVQSTDDLFGVIVPSGTFTYAGTALISPGAFHVLDGGEI